MPTPRPRLDALRLGSLRARVPTYDRDRFGVGIAHIGVGAFHKAHQALYTEAALARSGGHWKIAGVSLKSPRARDELSAQDNLYSVAIRDGANEEIQVVGALKEVFVAAEDRGKVIDVLSRPTVHVITLTITEKGYCLDGVGALDFDHAEIYADIRAPEAPVTAIGFLGAALSRRAGLNAPVTIVSCDNLANNGARLGAAMSEYLRRASPDCLDWCAANVRYPSTMVDRIVPAATHEARAQIDERLGLRDEASVVTERFSQWVIEDAFAGPRPEWEAGGAEFVADVAPYEAMKLRLLNGPHSAIAYLGSLAGLEFVHEAMAREEFGAYVRLLMDEEIAPEVRRPPGVDLGGYAQSLRQRFQNSALRHRTAQIAQDGSAKLPQRLLPMLRSRLKRGAPAGLAILAVAAWMKFVSGRDYSGRRIDVVDPLASRFKEMGLDRMSDENLVRSLLSLRQVFDEDLASSGKLVEGLIEALRKFRALGVPGTLCDEVASKMGARA